MTVTTRMSRRAWWMVTGGSLIAAASATLWWKKLLPGAGPSQEQPSATYVDHEGWIVSARDKERLSGS